VNRRGLVVGALAAAAVLGLIGVSAAALSGQTTQVAAPAQATSTTTAPPAPTTTVVVTTTAPPPTTITTKAAPPPTTTAPPATIPPTTVVPATTVAVVASMQISPATANFPSTPPPYWPMPIVHVTVTNTGATAISSVVVHPIGVYSIPSSSCGTLAPGQSCTADVQFCPNSPGSYDNTLTVTGQNAATRSPVQATIGLEGIAT